MLLRLLRRLETQPSFTRSLVHMKAAAKQAPKTAGRLPAKQRSPKKQPEPVVPDDALLEKAAKIASQLQELYKSPAIPLTHGSSYQLLVAVMLSAQTTDKKVHGCLFCTQCSCCLQHAAWALQYVLDRQQRRCHSVWHAPPKH
jgi:hypothetical protein